MNLLAGAFRIGWAGVLLWQIGGWMGPHVQPLSAGPQVSTAAGNTLGLPPVAGWQAIHVLVAGCGCSASVVDHLVERRARKNWQESVWLSAAAPEWRRRLTAAGFTVANDGPARIRQSRIPGGPRLLLAGAEGRLQWTGGYARRRPALGAEWLDDSTMDRLQASLTPPAVPVYGCVSTTEGTQ